MLALGKVLREIRHGRQFTQKQAAEQTGFVRATIQKWEAEIVRPPFAALSHYLEAICASDTQRDQALLLLRHVNGLALQPGETVGRKALPSLPPMPGLLLRALRHRKGLSLDELAARTGWTPGFLSRVENDERSLKPDKQAQLLDLLEAMPEERAALARDGGWLSVGRGLEPACSQADLDAIAVKREALRKRSAEGTLCPMELYLLALQEQLWPLVRRHNACAIGLLAEIYQDMAEWNFQRGQREPAGQWVERGLSLFDSGFDPDLARRMGGTLNGLLLQRAIVATRRGGWHDPHRGLRVLRDAPARLERDVWQVRTQLLRALAAYAAQCGDTARAWALFQDAERQTGDEESYQFGLKWIRMRLLIEMGEPDAALTVADYIACHYPRQGTERVRFELFVSQALLAAGRKTEAQERFQDNETFCRKRGYKHIIEERRDLARRLGIPDAVFEVHRVTNR